MDQPRLLLPQNRHWWQLYCPALSEQAHGHVLRYITDNLLEPLARVGATGIYLIGIFHSDTDHGFGIVSYDVARNIGTNQDLRELIVRAHELGLKVCLDIVPNHVSKRHDLAQQCLMGNPEYQDVLVSFTPEEAATMRQNGLPSFFGDEPFAEINGRCYLSSFVTGRMLDLNWRSSVVRKYFRAVIQKFRDIGVDAFRIDCGMMLMRDLSDLDPTNPMSSLRPAASVAALQEVFGDTLVFYEWFDPRDIDIFLKYPNAFAIDCSFVMTNQAPDLSIQHPKLVRLYGGHDQVTAADRGLDMAKQFAAVANDFAVFTDIYTALGWTTKPGILPGDDKIDSNLESASERYRSRRRKQYYRSTQEFVRIVNELFPRS